MLVELTGAASVVLRTERGISRAEGLDLRDGPYWGTPPDGPILIAEHGLQFAVDLAEGQKTGMYLDQRENRLAAASYFRGRRVLDMFCYTGGFSLAAAIRGARDARRRFQRQGDRPGRGQRPAERRRRGAVPDRRRLRDAAIAALRGRALRRDRPRSAEVRPQPPRPGRRPPRLSLAESTRGRAARPGRNPRHLQLLRTRCPRRFPHDAPGRRPADPPRHPDTPGARGARPTIPSPSPAWKAIT